MAFAQVAFARFRRHRGAVAPIRVDHSLVRILDGDAEIEHAIDRALGFERGIADLVAGRISHYEELQPRPVVVELSAAQLNPASLNAAPVKRHIDDHPESA